MKKLLASVVLTLGLVGFGAQSSAAPITGTPVGNGFGWTPNSTNALNFAMLVPGREGQSAPHVLFDSSAPGQVTLDFYNPTLAALAFFEYRIDGVSVGGTGHPVVLGDVIEPGVSLSAGDNALDQVFAVTQYIDVRLALGGERDWDFDWVRFEVAQLPEPGTLALLGLGLVGLAVARRRKAS